jgi:hypothetical protein
MELKTYKVVTGWQDVEFVEADSVVMESNSGRLNFFVAGNPVASFVGYNSFNVYTPPAEEPESPTV